MKYDVAIFDFDGTICNSAEGITAHLKRTLEEMNYPPLSQETLNKFIGPSLLVSFRVHCGMDDDTARKAIDIYRREYDTEGYKLGFLYEGLVDLVKKLRENGIKTVIASAKPQYILDPVVEYFGLNAIFDKIVGSEQEGRPSNDKKAIVERCLMGKNCVMIGDSPYDIDGGRDNGLDTIAVTYGFGFTSKETALASSPTYVAESVEELERILLG